MGVGNVTLEKEVTGVKEQHTRDIGGQVAADIADTQARANDGNLRTIRATIGNIGESFAKIGESLKKFLWDRPIEEAEQDIIDLDRTCRQEGYVDAEGGHKGFDLQRGTEAKDLAGRWERFMIERSQQIAKKHHLNALQVRELETRTHDLRFGTKARLAEREMIEGAEVEYKRTFTRASSGIEAMNRDLWERVDNTRRMCPDQIETVISDGVDGYIRSMNQQIGTMADRLCVSSLGRISKDVALAKAKETYMSGVKSMIKGFTDRGDFEVAGRIVTKGGPMVGMSEQQVKDTIRELELEKADYEYKQERRARVEAGRRQDAYCREFLECDNPEQHEELLRKYARDPVLVGHAPEAAAKYKDQADRMKAARIAAKQQRPAGAAKAVGVEKPVEVRKALEDGVYEVVNLMMGDNDTDPRLLQQKQMETVSRIRTAHEGGLLTEKEYYDLEQLAAKKWQPQTMRGVRKLWEALGMSSGIEEDSEGVLDAFGARSTGPSIFGRTFSNREALELAREVKRELDNNPKYINDEAAVDALVEKVKLDAMAGKDFGEINQYALEALRTVQSRLAIGMSYAKSEAEREERRRLIAEGDERRIGTGDRVISTAPELGQSYPVGGSFVLPGEVGPISPEYRQRYLRATMEEAAERIDTRTGARPSGVKATEDEIENSKRR